MGPGSYGTLALLYALIHPTSGKGNSAKSRFRNLHSPHPSGRVSYTSMGEFFSDLKSLLGLRMLGKVMLGVRRNDLLGLAGQLGAVIVFMLWLYVTGLMVLLGLEINAVLARTAEERKGIELVQTE